MSRCGPHFSLILIHAFPIRFDTVIRYDTAHSTLGGRIISVSQKKILDQPFYSCIFSRCIRDIGNTITLETPAVLPLTSHGMSQNSDTCSVKCRHDRCRYRQQLVLNVAAKIRFQFSFFFFYNNFLLNTASYITMNVLAVCCFRSPSHLEVFTPWCL